VENGAISNRVLVEAGLHWVATDSRNGLLLAAFHIKTDAETFANAARALGVPVEVEPIEARG
jgi:hypothetical protein